MSAVTNSSLDTCGCCQPIAASTTVFNRPGLPALKYRIGTQSSFLAEMLNDLRARLLPGGPIPPVPTLAALTTLTTDDPAIALMDAWAVVTDVLTFYQERIANEGYLRTATERLSVLQLARAIGYELSPGVAASTYLAFTLQDSPGAPARVTIATGTKVMSVPPQGKMPQTFETIEGITARPEWNAIRPKTTYPQVFNAGDTSVFLDGTNTQLQVGDAILIVGDERLFNPPLPESTAEDRWDFRIVTAVKPYADLKVTQVSWDAGLGGGGIPPTVTNPRLYVLRQRAHIFGYNAPDARSMAGDVRSNYGIHTGEDWPGLNPFNSWNVINLDASYPKVGVGSWVVLTQQYGQGLTPLKEAYLVTNAATVAEANFTLSGQVTRLELDSPASLSQYGRRQTVVFAQSEQLHWVDRPFTSPDPTNGTVTLTNTITGAILNPLGGADGLHLNLAAVVPGLAQRQSLIIAGQWVRLQVSKASGNLSFQPVDGSAVSTLTPGEILQVLSASIPATAGTRIWHVLRAMGAEGYVTALPSSFVYYHAEKADPVVSETVVIDQVQLSADGSYSIVTIVKPVMNIYEPASVTIYGNVLHATHGETVTEILGSGDSSRVNQNFVLKKPPLTYTSAATPSGSESTLTVRVNQILWQESPSLYGLGSRDESYIVRIDDSAAATLTFGDGLRGERPPTGQDNIVATYRSGIGPDGEVDANTLTMLQTRPLGVRGVTNPMAATGAAAPERLADARTNAPLKVQTLDRIVSLGDYESFASAFAGIGKAQAAALWNKTTRIVYLTVGAVDGSTIDPDTPLITNLMRAIQDFHDPVQIVQVGSYTKLTFSVAATIMIDPKYLTDLVLANVKAALLDTFSFAQRKFGQAVTGAEAVTTMQLVKGVVAVELENLTSDSSFGWFPLRLLGIRTAALSGFSTHRLQPRFTFTSSGRAFLPTSPVDTILNANTARYQDETIYAAELLTINPNGITLKGINP